jgi:hypothetical protein
VEDIVVMEAMAFEIMAMDLTVVIREITAMKKITAMREPCGYCNHRGHHIDDCHKRIWKNTQANFDDYNHHQHQHQSSNNYSNYSNGIRKAMTIRDSIGTVPLRFLAHPDPTNFGSRCI